MGYGGAVSPSAEGALFDYRQAIGIRDGRRYLLAINIARLSKKQG